MFILTVKETNWFIIKTIMVKMSPPNSYGLMIKPAWFFGPGYCTFRFKFYSFCVEVIRFDSLRKDELQNMIKNTVFIINQEEKFTIYRPPKFRSDLTPIVTSYLDRPKTRGYVFFKVWRIALYPGAGIKRINIF